MKNYLLYALFILTIGSMVALVANVFGESREETPIATAIDIELDDFSEMFAMLSETFDEPIADADIIRIETLASNPELNEANVHELGTIDVIFKGRSTTLTLETEVYREDGTYLYLYLIGEPDVVEALDERIMTYYEESGI